VSVTIIESIAMSQTAIDIENNVEEDELSIWDFSAFKIREMKIFDPLFLWFVLLPSSQRQQTQKANKVAEIESSSFGKWGFRIFKVQMLKK
jgi:hypothetical protein